MKSNQLHHVVSYSSCFIWFLRALSPDKKKMAEIVTKQRFLCSLRSLPLSFVSQTEIPLSFCFADRKSLVLMFRRHKIPCPSVSQTEKPLPLCFADTNSLVLLFRRQKSPCPSVSQTEIPLSFCFADKNPLVLRCADS